MGFLYAGYRPYGNLISQKKNRNSSNLQTLHLMDSKETLREKARWGLHKNDMRCIEQIHEVISQNNSSTTFNLPSNELLKKDEQDILENAGRSNVILWTLKHGCTSVDADPQLIAFNSFMRRLHAAKRTSQKLCPIGSDGKRESKESELSA